MTLDPKARDRAMDVYRTNRDSGRTDGYSVEAAITTYLAALPPPPGMPSTPQNSINDLRFDAPPTVAVGEVRALEWVGDKGRGGGYFYEVAEPNRTWGWRVWVRPDMGAVQVVGGGIVTMKAETREAAIATAQADYETRIRSALVPPPPQGEPVTGAVVLAAGPHSIKAALIDRMTAMGNEPTPALIALSAQPTAGWREGVEAAAKWHEDRAAQHGGAQTDSDREGNEWHSGQAALHLDYAREIRSLTPPPPANAGGKL